LETITAIENDNYEKYIDAVLCEERLEAAGAKWNFLPFKPDLAGGHCIGVDFDWDTRKKSLI